MKENNKNAWQTPEIIDLDVVNKTEGKLLWTVETTTTGTCGPS